MDQQEYDLLYEYIRRKEFPTTISKNKRDSLLGRANNLKLWRMDCYVRLSGDEMDLLIDWMVDLKGKYMEDGEALLSSLTGALLSFKTG